MTRSDVGKGHPSTTRTWPSASHARPRLLLRQPVRQPGQPARARDTTGPEIWEQMEHRLDAVVCGVGTGGTHHRPVALSSRTVSPQVRDGAGRSRQARCSPSYVTTGKRRRKMTARGWSEGIGEDFMPPVARSVARGGGPTRSPTRRAFRMLRELLQDRRASWPAPPPARCCAAALRYCRDADAAQARRHASCATAATSTSPRSTTTTGCSTRASSSASAYGDLRDLIARRTPRARRDHGRTPTRRCWRPTSA